MKTIRVTRSGFSNGSAVYFCQYAFYVLSKKYNVVLDNKNPDLVFCSNLYTQTDALDSFTGENATVETQYPNAKKIFMSGEHVPDYGSHIRGSDYYAIGHPFHSNKDKGLDMQYHSVATSWFLYHECNLFPDHHSWMTAPRVYKPETKKYFCGIVQNSKIQYRRELYDKLSKYKFIKAYGGFEYTVGGYNKYSGPPKGSEVSDYYNKIKYLEDCTFSIHVQSTNYPGLTHEKMIHAYAANTIPIFWGNDEILRDGFNPESFVNCHDYSTIDEVVEAIIRINENPTTIKKMIEAPMFVNNKIPDEYSHDYLLNFLSTIIEK